MIQDFSKANQGLMAQALQPQQNQGAGTGLARILTVLLAKKNQEKQQAGEDATRQADIGRILAAQSGQPYSAAGEQMAGPPSETNPQALQAALLQSKDPRFQEAGISQMMPQQQRNQQIIEVGVKGQIGMVQKAIVGADGQLQPIGSPYQQKSGTTVNVGGKGQDAMDKKVGADLAEFEAGGGFADVQKNLDQLKDVKSELESGAELTGPITGNVPDFIQQFTNPQAIDTREKVEEVVQRNLRVILGAQFTEKEGERLIARAFNPKLDEGQNLKRVERLMKQIADAAMAKQEALTHFKQYGTMKGFTGKTYTTADFDPDSLFAEDIETDMGADPYIGADPEVDALLNKYAPNGQ